MRRLFIITHNFPPSAASGSFRMLGLARHLPKFDWNVSVVACPRMPWEPVDQRLAEDVPRETRVEYVPYPEGRLAIWMRALLFWTRVVDGHLVWTGPAYRACRKLIAAERPDVLLTSGPPHSVHVLGRRLKRAFGIPWVADFRDPWIRGRDQEPKRQRLARVLEESVFRNADLLVANAPNASRALQEALPHYRAKIISITNGFDPEAFPPPSRAPDDDQCIRVLHAGELYAARDPIPLFDALRDGLQVPGLLSVDFLGTANGSETRFAAEIARRGLKDVVHIRGQVPYHQAKQAMVDSDILLLLDTPGRRIGVPAKLYEYIGANRPVLALAEPDSDTANVLRDANVPHRIAPPSDAEAIRKALEDLIVEARGRTDEREIGICGQFTRESVARQMATALDSVSAKSDGRGSMF